MEGKEGSLGEPACGQLTELVVVPAVGAAPTLEARGGEGLTRGRGLAHVRRAGHAVKLGGCRVILAVYTWKIN